MRWWAAAVGLAVGCTPGDPGEAFVLGGEVDVDERRVDAAAPVRVRDGARLSTAGDTFELGGGELAVLDGDVILAYTFGDEIATDAIGVDGPADAVLELVDSLGLERSGRLLLDDDVWAVLADADLDPRLSFSPVSGDDLPGTVSWGGEKPRAAASERRAGSPFAWGPGPMHRETPSSLRARSLFSLPDTHAADGIDGAGPGDPALVGRYCARGGDLVLSADGSSERCDAAGCVRAEWRLDGGRLLVGDDEWPVAPEGAGWRLDDHVDLVSGGCR